MRRFLTLASLALTTLVSAPVLAAGPGSGYNGGQRSQFSSAPAASYRPAALRPASRDVALSRADMRKAQALEVRYNRDLKRARAQLTVERQKLARLTRDRFTRPAQVLAAQRRVNASERKLTNLARNYQAALTRFLTPRQVRYFLSLS